MPATTPFEITPESARVALRIIAVQEQYYRDRLAELARDRKLCESALGQEEVDGR